MGMDPLCLATPWYVCQLHDVMPSVFSLSRSRSIQPPSITARSRVSYLITFIQVVFLGNSNEEVDALSPFYTVDLSGLASSILAHRDRLQMASRGPPLVAPARSGRASPGPEVDLLHHVVVRVGCCRVRSFGLLLI